MSGIIKEFLSAQVTGIIKEFLSAGDGIIKEFLSAGVRDNQRVPVCR